MQQIRRDNPIDATGVPNVLGLHFRPVNLGRIGLVKRNHPNGKSLGWLGLLQFATLLDS